MNNRSSLSQQQRKKKSASASSVHGIWRLKDFDGRVRIFNSDPDVLHFLYLEGDERVRSVDDDIVAELLAVYGPWPAGNRLPWLATLTDGTRHLRVLSRSNHAPSIERQIALLADGLRAEAKVIRKEDLVEAHVRTVNWMRLFGFYNRSSTLVTELVIGAIIEEVSRRRELAISDLMARFPGFDPALLMGGLAVSLRRRKIFADLDARHLSLHTNLWGNA